MDERALILSSGLLLGLLLAGLVALLMAARRQTLRQAQRHAQQQAHTEARLDELVQTLAEYQQGNIRMGEELIALRDKLSRMENRQQRFEQQDVQAMPYNQATRLVAMGASLDDLMQSCGLTRSEAELMLKLHGKE